MCNYAQFVAGTFHRRVFMLLCLVFCVAAIAFGQGTMEDIVHLKNGGIIRGVVFENMPNAYVKIQTPDGKIKTYKFSEIEKLSKAGQPPVKAVAADVQKLDSLSAKPSSIPIEQQSQKPLAEQQPKPSTNITTNESKSSTTSFLLSFLIPGLGQFYNGEYTKGAIMTGAAVIGTTLIFTAGYTETYSASPYTDYSYYGTYTYYNYNYEEETTAWFYVGIAMAGGSWVWSMIDAPISANRINSEMSRNTMGHLIELDGNGYIVGMDVVARPRGVGVNLAIHF